MSNPTITPINYAALPTPEQVQATAAAIQARGIRVEIVATAAAALAKIHTLIPAGSSIMTGGSKTLRDIGLEDQLIAKDHPWINLKDEILAQTDPVMQMELRTKSILAPYFLGSVQSIVQTGEILIASASGSQLASYAFSSRNIIWVAGVQKIVPTLEDGLRRIRDYALPIEDQRMKTLGYPGSLLAKTLIIEHEPAQMQRNVNLILVNEPVGV